MVQVQTVTQANGHARNMGFLEARPHGIYTKVKLTSYSNGDGECVYTKLDSRDQFKAQRNRTDKDLVLPEQKIVKLPSLEELDKELEHKNRSLRRAKSTVRKKIIEGQLDHLLTLTYKENMTNESTGWNDFTKFIRGLRCLNPNIKWLVVMEKQKRGAVHFHLAIHGYLHARSVRNLWLDVVGEGNIDIQRKKDKQSFSSLGSYLSKYLSKQKNTLERFGKMFRSSQNIKLNETHFFLPVDVWCDQRIAQLFLLLHEKILTRWDSGNQGAFHSKFIASF